MKTNVATKPVPVFNNEGVRVKRTGPETQLMRLLGTCMLWEDSFYMDGKSIAQMMAELVPQCRPDFVAAAAVYTRHTLNLRHAPLLVVTEMLKHSEHKKLVGRLLPDVIARADEISEFLSIYWKDGKRPIAKQAKLGLGRAFNKFTAYQLAKFDSNKAAITLRDVMFLVHAKPADAQGLTKEERKDADKMRGLMPKESLFFDLANDKLPTPDTWETELSAGADKKETFTRLMQENRLGALAFLRNLRNMDKAGVDRTVIRAYSELVKLDRVLPYRFIAAARVVPQYEDILEQMMFRSLQGIKKLTGRTALLIDISPSMGRSLSSKSDLTRRDAALGLTILGREMFEDCSVFSVSNDCVEVAPRRGFALGDALYSSQQSNGTKLGRAVHMINGMNFDRVIMITDEESQDPVPAMKALCPYIINVAPSKHGVGFGRTVTISGFSEAVLAYISLLEKEDAQ